MWTTNNIADVYSAWRQGVSSVYHLPWSAICSPLFVIVCLQSINSAVVQLTLRVYACRKSLYSCVAMYSIGSQCIATWSECRCMVLIDFSPLLTARSIVLYYLFTPQQSDFSPLLTTCSMVHLPYYSFTSQQKLNSTASFLSELQIYFLWESYTRWNSLFAKPKQR